MGEKMTLLPCPFCGNTDDFEGSPFPNGRRTSWIIRCGVPNCGCEIVGDSPEGVTKRWNTRHLATPAQTMDIERKSWIDGWMAGFISTMPPLSAIKTVDLQRHAEKAWSDKLSQAIGDKT